MEHPPHISTIATLIVERHLTEVSLLRSLKPPRQEKSPQRPQVAAAAAAFFDWREIGKSGALTLMSPLASDRVLARQRSGDTVGGKK